MFDHISIPTILISYIALLFSLSVHEASHATAAYLLDDDTAARLGRMTINPLVHIDPIGTVLFPLIGMTTGFPLIGWAKPVPYNPQHFTRKVTMRTGAALVSAAGPASNIALFVLFMLVTTLTLRFSVADPSDRLVLFYAGLQGPEAFSRMAVSPAQMVMLSFAGRLILINILLAIFNLIPVGPLDGGGILKGFLPYRATQWFERHQRTMYIILVVMVMVPFLSDLFLTPIFRVALWPIQPVARVLLGA
ncbi:MAG: site-2 protease family protein [Holophagaceae bacterium]|nr:site-2 protease family protein [Holophagaceae bacterium]